MVLLLVARNTLYIKIYFYSSPPNIRQVKQEGGAMGEDIDCLHDTLGGPAGSHISQLDLTRVSRAYDKNGSFYTIIL